jgi:hypothetical protein
MSSVVAQGQEQVEPSCVGYSSGPSASRVQVQNNCSIRHFLVTPIVYLPGNGAAESLFRRAMSLFGIDLQSAAQFCHRKRYVNRRLHTTPCSSCAKGCIQCVSGSDSFSRAQFSIANPGN